MNSRTWLVSYVLIAIVAISLLTYVVFNRLMYDVVLADIISGLLAIASFLAGRYSNDKKT
jgi:hypothetical protein